LTGFGRLCYFDFALVRQATPGSTKRPRFVANHNPVITGFNTDIPHEGVTYHVQTEDKGLDTPLILSLVYVGGAIIASKRTRYDDLIETGFDEEALTARLQRQHKLICAAIRAGRVEELKRMGGPQGSQADEGVAKNGNTSAPEVKPVGARKKRAAATKAVKPDDAGETRQAVRVNDNSVGQQTSEIDSGRQQTSEIEILTTVMDEISALPDTFVSSSQVYQEPELFVPTTKQESELSVPASKEEMFAEEPLQIEHSPVMHEPFVAPAQIATPLQHAASPEAGANSDELYLTLLDDEGEFRAGQLATVKVHVGRGAYGQTAVPDASVTVKVLGTSFRPLILMASTDEHGVAVVRALLPRFTSGRAAIIIRAVADEDAAEMRRIIHQA
jgi:hypothetical protein